MTNADFGAIVSGKYEYEAIWSDGGSRSGSVDFDTVDCDSTWLCRCNINK